MSPIKDPYDPKTGKCALWILGILVLMTFLFISGFFVLAKVMQQRDIQTYGEELLQFCLQPPAQPNLSAPEVPEVAGKPHPQVLTVLGNRVEGIQRQLPDEWRADTLEQVDVIICTTHEKKSMGQCSYQSGCIAKKYQILMYLEAYDRNGRWLANGLLEGGQPICPQVVKSSECKNDVYGKSPDVSLYQSWLEEKFWRK
jgi:hypothetical protein